MMPEQIRHYFIVALLSLMINGLSPTGLLAFTWSCNGVSHGMSFQPFLGEEPFYIPESKSIDVKVEVGQGQPLRLLLVYPFFQGLKGMKVAENSAARTVSISHADILTFHTLEITSEKEGAKILTLTFEIGRELMWVYKATPTQGHACLLELPLSSAIEREFRFNKGLKEFLKTQLTAIESGVYKVIPGIGEGFSTSTSFWEGDFHAVFRSSTSQQPEVFRAVAIYDLIEGIETKQYYVDSLVAYTSIQIGQDYWHIAPVPKIQRAGADIFFDIKHGDVASGDFFILQKGAAPTARIGYDEKLLFLAEEWHALVAKQQAKWKEKGKLEAERAHEAYLEAKAKDAFTLIGNFNGREVVLADGEAISIFKLSDQWSVVMNKGGSYALLNNKYQTSALKFIFSGVDFFPSGGFVGLKGEHPSNGLVICLKTGFSLARKYQSFSVRNEKMYAEADGQIFVFDQMGLQGYYDAKGKVLYESPKGQYILLKSEGKGLVAVKGGAISLPEDQFFTQLKTVSDNGVLLGRVNQKIAQDLKRPELTLQMHFYQISNGRIKLFKELHWEEAALLSHDLVAGLSANGTYDVYHLDGSLKQKTSFRDLKSLVQTMAVEEQMKMELRPASLKESSLQLIGSAGEQQLIYSIQGFQHHLLKAIR
jgi:hypothetical protein